MLDRLSQELEQAEWVTLQPAVSWLHEEQETLQADLGHLQAQNAALAAIADRYADLLARARGQLAGLASEREALRAEYERALR